ncbi:MAG: cadA [Ferruginibacter sp.]|nr:cadA [Ferruginibacter sp.]
MQQQPEQKRNEGTATVAAAATVHHDGHGNTKQDADEHDHDHDDHDHDHGGADAGWKSHWPLLSSLAILVLMLVMEYGFHIIPPFPVDLVVYVAAYLLAGYNVLNLAFRKAKRFDFFNEFFLMSVATVGAFAIGSYSEAVAVMVFYSIGEWFQDAAVNKAKKSIKALLDIRPEEVTVIRDGQPLLQHPSSITLNEIIRVKPGEKLALDGLLETATASFNTAALTGESKPDTKMKGDAVFAGMINLEKLVEVKVIALFKDSKLSKILEMVQDATARKSQTQLFISRFAKIYTPIVFALAIAVCLVPYFFTGDYNFQVWFYRALVFLVISCPCALVVSIPLGYFGGIGLASRNGILFKGSNFLDVVSRLNMIVMDKTGTLTKGVFSLQEVVAVDGNEQALIATTASLEANSTHPIARAILAYAGKDFQHATVENLEEIAGHGLKGTIDNKAVLAGNAKLMNKFAVVFPKELTRLSDTIVMVAINGEYAGYLRIADEIKPDAKQAIDALHKLNIRTVMLSGDKQSVVDHVAKELGIDQAFGDLLPEGKLEKLQQLQAPGNHIAFVGDGVNDAPVVALADAGIAMGGLGSDATIETADIVIQNDEPSKIVTAINIGKITRRIVWQNIIIAMVVKVIVLLLGAGGIATLWEAVIADVGVALIAIFNAVRIQQMKV